MQYHSSHVHFDGRDSILSLEEGNQVCCLDLTHVILRGHQEVQLSPTEYALFKLLFLGSRLRPFVPLITLEWCFRFFTDSGLETTEKQSRLPGIQRLPSVCEADFRLFTTIIQLKQLEGEKDFSALITILNKFARDPNPFHFAEEELFLLQSFLLLKKEEHTDLRKRISKHISGANAKFKYRGAGIQILSVGQLEGYMPLFSRGPFENPGMRYLLPQ